jgi:hypothetical protein
MARYAAKDVARGAGGGGDERCAGEREEEDVV